MAHSISEAVDPHLLRTAERVIILGKDAHVEPPFEMKAKEIERWEIAEPGGEGADRMDKIRDEIQTRVDELVTDMG